LSSPLQSATSEAISNYNPVRRVSPKPAREERVVKIVRDPGAAYRVLIVDRDSMSSDLLANALVRDRGCEAAAIHAEDLLGALAESDVDLVVIAAEIVSKSGSGFDLARTISCAYPAVSVVILLHRATHESVVNAFRAGARGVFSRQQQMSEFLDCVEHVRKGYIWAARQETDFLLAAFKSIPAPNVIAAVDAPTLTSREMQVVQGAAVGKTNRTIAGELGLSEHTVKNYLFRAFEKLGVSSRVELLFYLTIRGHSLGASASASSETDFEPECQGSVSE
jgi:two-component system, NarL family, nitrate/nitrite response regulator NarL